MGGCGARFISRVLFEKIVNHAWSQFNMKSSKSTAFIFALVASCLVLSVPMAVSAKEVDSSIAACLKAWGDHPFGKEPQFKTLGTSVTVFGIGTKAGDTERTSAPALVLIKPIVNVMGESTIELLNPNGWYCLQTTVDIIGGVNVRAHCKAKLASTSDGKAVLADNTENRSIKDLTLTVMGGLSIERPCN